MKEKPLFFSINHPLQTKMAPSKMCFFLVIFPLVVFGKPQVPCYFIFGDSLVDNGNNNNLQTTAKVNYLPYGVDFPAGPTGRFNNGRNIADFIAELLGFDKPISQLSNATDQDYLRGVNYGSGGAGILHETGAVFFGDVISLNEQLSNHKVTISRITKLVGSKRAANKHLRSCLYSIGMGNNDYLGNYLPQLYSSDTPSYTPQQFAALLITQYSKQLLKLYGYGARKVAVFGVGKLGCVPQQVAAYGVSNGSVCFETTNNIVQLFNKQLQLLINTLNYLPGANFVYTTDHADNVSYGNMKELSEPCCATSVETSGHCIPGTVPCSNREEYYFWDSFHPTEAATLIGANIAYAHMSPLFSSPIHLW